MSSARSARSATADTAADPVMAVCEAIRGRIEDRRDQVCREIGEYPTPIPACDVHFNRLLEERRKVFEDLDRLGDISGGARASEIDVAAIDALIVASTAIPEKEKPALRRALQTAAGGG